VLGRPEKFYPILLNQCFAVSPVTGDSIHLVVQYSENLSKTPVCCPNTYPEFCLVELDRGVGSLANKKLNGAA
jgi:hypothetical protein